MIQPTVSLYRNPPLPAPQIAERSGDCQEEKSKGASLPDEGEETSSPSRTGWNYLKRPFTCIAALVQQAVSATWEHLSALSCFSPSPNSAQAVLLQQASSAPAFNAVKVELTTADPKQRLKHTESSPLHSDTHTIDKIKQNSSAESISNFFRQGYIHAIQTVSFRLENSHYTQNTVCQKSLSEPNTSLGEALLKLAYGRGNSRKYSRTLIREIAKRLVRTEGTVDTAIIPQLLSLFFPPGRTLDPWEAHAKFVLKALLSSEDLRNALAKVRHSNDSEHPGTRLIRSTLALAQETPISDREAQQTALDALLSYCRQGKSGSCFASFLTIELQKSSLEMCLADFASLIYDSCLYRKVSGKTVQFPFDPTTNLEMDGTPSTLSTVSSNETDSYNPLLRVWETVIAGMAEASDSGFIKPQIVDSILFALERKLVPGTNPSAEAEGPISAAVKEALQKRIQLLYCPQIPHLGYDDDGNSVQGAFVVYDTHHAPHSSIWTRVDNPEKFKLFILSVIDEVKDAFDQAGSELSPSAQTSLRNIRLYVEQEEFILQTLKKCGYHQEKNPLANLDKIDNTPWMFKTGTNPKKVLQYYFELEATPQLQAHMFHDAHQLLFKIAERFEKDAWWMADTAELDIRLPGAIQGLHAFSFLPSHPTFWPLITNKEQTDTYLEQKTLVPGQEIAAAPLSKASRAHIIQACEKKLIPADKKGNFLREAETLEQDLTIQEFRNELLKTLICKSENQGMDARLKLELDNILVKHLPALIQKKLADSAIHFADTNWKSKDGAYDVHFCVVVNPGTAKLEMWKINSNGTKPVPLEQNYWLLGHAWEFYP